DGIVAEQVFAAPAPTRVGSQNDPLHVLGDALVKRPAIREHLQFRPEAPDQIAAFKVSVKKPALNVVVQQEISRRGYRRVDGSSESQCPALDTDDYYRRQHDHCQPQLERSAFRKLRPDGKICRDQKSSNPGGENDIAPGE